MFDIYGGFDWWWCGDGGGVGSVTVEHDFTSNNNLIEKS